MKQSFTRYIEARTIKQAREKFWRDKGSSVPPSAPWTDMTVFEFEVTINYPFKVEPGELARRIQD